MRNYSCILVAAVLASCSQPPKPQLKCRIDRVEMSHAAGTAAENSMLLEANLDPSKLTKGVWDFSGVIKRSNDKGNDNPINGMFYRYPDGSFDLVASSEDLRITIMPSNPILRERQIQGVTMEAGQVVANGNPISASCQIVKGN